MDSTAQSGVEAAWEEIYNKNKIKIDRQPMKREDGSGGLYKYKIDATFPFAAKTFFDFIMDLEYRKEWDVYLKTLELLQKEGRSELIYWCVKFPWPLANRDYVYIRQANLDSATGTYVVTSRGTISEKVPTKKGVVRVDSYISDFTIRPATPNSCALIMDYFDDIGGNIPNSVMNWAISTALPSSLGTLIQACTTYQKKTKTTSDRHFGREQVNKDARQGQDARRVVVGSQLGRKSQSKIYREVTSPPSNRSDRISLSKASALSSSPTTAAPLAFADQSTVSTAGPPGLARPALSVPLSARRMTTDSMSSSGWWSPTGSDGFSMASEQESHMDGSPGVGRYGGHILSSKEASGLTQRRWFLLTYRAYRPCPVVLREPELMGGDSDEERSPGPGAFVPLRELMADRHWRVAGAADAVSLRELPAGPERPPGLQQLYKPEEESGTGSDGVLVGAPKQGILDWGGAELVSPFVESGYYTLYCTLISVDGQDVRQTPFLDVMRQLAPQRSTGSNFLGTAVTDNAHAHATRRTLVFCLEGGSESSVGGGTDASEVGGEAYGSGAWPGDQSGRRRNRKRGKKHWKGWHFFKEEGRRKFTRLKRRDEKFEPTERHFERTFSDSEEKRRDLRREEEEEKEIERDRTLPDGIAGHHQTPARSGLWKDDLSLIAGKRGGKRKQLFKKLNRTYLELRGGTASKPRASSAPSAKKGDPLSESSSSAVSPLSSSPSSAGSAPPPHSSSTPASSSYPPPSASTWYQQSVGAPSSAEEAQLLEIVAFWGEDSNTDPFIPAWQTSQVPPLHSVPFHRLPEGLEGVLALMHEERILAAAAYLRGLLKRLTQNDRGGKKGEATPDDQSLDETKIDKQQQRGAETLPGQASEENDVERDQPCPVKTTGASKTKGQRKRSFKQKKKGKGGKEVAKGGSSEEREHKQDGKSETTTRAEAATEQALDEEQNRGDRDDSEYIYQENRKGEQEEGKLGRGGGAGGGEREEREVRDRAAQEGIAESGVEEAREGREQQSQRRERDTGSHQGQHVGQARSAVRDTTPGSLSPRSESTPEQMFDGSKTTAHTVTEAAKQSASPAISSTTNTTSRTKSTATTATTKPGSVPSPAEKLQTYTEFLKKYNSERVQKELRRLRERELACRMALRDFNLEGEAGWIFGQKFLGITTYYKRGEEGTIWLKLDGVVEDVNIFHCLSVVRETDLFSTWVPFTNKSSRLAMPSLVEVVTYFNVALPMVLSRDAVLHAFAVDASLEYNCVLIVGKSVDAWEGVEIPPIKGWNADRMIIRGFRAQVTPFTRTSARTCIVANIDPKAKLPQKLVNLVIRKIAGVLLYLLQEESKKIGKEVQEHERRSLRALEKERERARKEDREHKGGKRRKRQEKAGGGGAEPEEAAEDEADSAVGEDLPIGAVVIPGTDEEAEQETEEEEEQGQGLKQQQQQQRQRGQVQENGGQERSQEQRNEQQLKQKGRRGEGSGGGSGKEREGGAKDTNAQEDGGREGGESSLGGARGENSGERGGATGGSSGGGQRKGSGKAILLSAANPHAQRIQDDRDGFYRWMEPRMEHFFTLLEQNELPPPFTLSFEHGLPGGTASSFSSSAVNAPPSSSSSSSSSSPSSSSLSAGTVTKDPSFIRQGTTLRDTQRSHSFSPQIRQEGRRSLLSPLTERADDVLNDLFALLDKYLCQSRLGLFLPLCLYLLPLSRGGGGVVLLCLINLTVILATGLWSAAQGRLRAATSNRDGRVEPSLSSTILCPFALWAVVLNSALLLFSLYLALDHWSNTSNNCAQPLAAGSVLHTFSYMFSLASAVSNLFFACFLLAVHELGLV